MRIAWLFALVAALLIHHLAVAVPRAQEANSPAASLLDYEYFKTKVQPIFLARRDGHTRCVSCHSKGTPMIFQRLSAGATTWNEEQSKRNFQVVAARVVPHNLAQSKILVHPLLAEGGGDFYHSGGKHWNSILDPEWQTIANWVCGRKANEKPVELTGACAGGE
jgi:hypothetical protein